MGSASTGMPPPEPHDVRDDIALVLAGLRRVPPVTPDDAARIASAREWFAAILDRPAALEQLAQLQDAGLDVSGLLRVLCLFAISPAFFSKRLVRARVPDFSSAQIVHRNPEEERRVLERHEREFGAVEGIEEVRLICDVLAAMNAELDARGRRDFPLKNATAFVARVDGEVVAEDVPDRGARGRPVEVELRVLLLVVAGLFQSSLGRCEPAEIARVLADGLRLPWRRPGGERRSFRETLGRVMDNPEPQRERAELIAARLGLAFALPV